MSHFPLLKALPKNVKRHPHKVPQCLWHSSNLKCLLCFYFTAALPFRSSSCDSNASSISALLCTSLGELRSAGPAIAHDSRTRSFMHLSSVYRGTYRAISYGKALVKKEHVPERRVDFAALSLSVEKPVLPGITLRRFLGDGQID